MLSTPAPDDDPAGFCRDNIQELMKQPNPSLIFDRQLIRRRRERAAATISRHDFLLKNIAQYLLERLDDIRRPFDTVLDLGCHHGILGRMLLEKRPSCTLVSCDPSLAMLALAGGTGVVADEEYLPFQPDSFDLIISNLSLHWVNDLPGTLLQIKNCLKPDGFFLGSVVGGDSLCELRRCLFEAELDLHGGACARVSPFITLRDAAGLLQRAGFAIPVADVDTMTLLYSSLFQLCADIRGCGHSNAVIERSRVPTSRSLILAAAERYQKLHAEADGRLPVTCQIVYLSGWKPHLSQQQPLRPASAAHRLAQALNAREQVTSDPVRPAGHVTCKTRPA